MKRKLLYFAQWNYSPHNGISKKIISQVGGLNEFYDADLCLIEDDKITLNKKIILNAKNNFLSKVRKYFYFFNIIKTYDYDYLYVRNVRGSSSILLFLVLLYANIKGIKVALEIPTYPFQQEHSVKNPISFIFEKLVQFMYRYILSVITYMGKESEYIWGVKTIKLENGVDVERLPLKSTLKSNNGLNIIGVGSLDYWHGYDRVLRGIENMSNVSFHIVGDGKEKEYLVKLANDLNLEHKVIFHGNLFDESLDKIFDKCDIAIDSLGRHRSGNENNSSIKSKEYAARGIPFILAHNDDSFEKAKFVYKIPANDSPVDFSMIISWKSSMDMSSSEIRKFAVDNLRWSTQFSKLKFIFPLA